MEAEHGAPHCGAFYVVLPGRKAVAERIAVGATQPTLCVFGDAVLTQVTVTAADVAASNGVIHVLSGVLIPNLSGAH